MSNVRVVPATAYHALDLAFRLREADRREIKASSGFTPEDALAWSLRMSTKAWAVVIDGRPEALFGVSPWPATTDMGSPWLLASDKFETIGREVARQTRYWISLMEAEYPLLCNYVDARHSASIRWLLWAGFQLDKLDLHHGVERRPFFRFSKVQSPCANQ